jgi:hypothetical protein
VLIRRSRGGGTDSSAVPVLSNLSLIEEHITQNRRIYGVVMGAKLEVFSGVQVCVLFSGVPKKVEEQSMQISSKRIVLILD